jgi:hypothetical protein
MLKIFLLTFIFATPQMAIGDIYKFVDTDGHVYYQDHARNSSYKLVVKTEALNSHDKQPKRDLKGTPTTPTPARISYNSGSFSSDSKLSLWPDASYKEQAKICESITGVFNNPKITPLKLCLYLTEMADDGNADFMKIYQVAALLIEIAK